MKSACRVLPVILIALVGCAIQSDDDRPAVMDSVPVKKVDLKKLEDELYRLGLAGFRRIRETHPNDQFYCFAFYTSGSYKFVTLTASSFEGLDAVAREYKQMPMYSAMSIEDLRRELKWSPNDSPLHEAAEFDLTPVDPLMLEVAAELDRRFDLKDNGRSSHEFEAQVRTCFVNALKRIEAEGTFGSGEERKKVVINLLMGDESDENRIGFAKRVNPPASVRMLKREIEEANRLRP